MLPASLIKRKPLISPETDYSTLSNYKDFKVLKSFFDIELNFKKNLIVGSIKYNLLTLNKIDKIVLDSSFIDIESIKVNNIDNPFKILSRIEPLGSALEIPFNTSLNNEIELLINFKTTKESTALQWLKNSDEIDYVFTQLEPIHARSLFPCFDTPSIKSKFGAIIKSKFPVVFSGLPLDSTGDIYKFEQEIPIPSYLIAIASGNIISSKIGPRSTIYAEPEMLQDSINEFKDDVENFIQISENLITPYIWTNYDFLINPPSFPYGGMENPNITFVTPTLISYDKSQVDVIAHELAHSWSGNNVTNCSWEHFYLNEGWTVYLERLITSTGKNGEIDEKFRHFQYIQGWNDLIDSINSLPKYEYSKLVQDLEKGKVDPDDTFSSVPYEKGSNFLFNLEYQLGGLNEFKPFIKFYFKKFEKSSIDTYQFIESLYEFYSKDDKKIKILDDFDWDLWLFTPGLPPKFPFDTTLVDQVSNLVKLWEAKIPEFTTEEAFKEFFDQDEHTKVYNSFSSPQKILFIDLLIDLKWTPISSISIINIYKDLDESRNTEIKFRLFKFKLLNKLTQFYLDLADWLATVGRMKYVRPSYRLLNEVDHKLAVETFQKNKDFYHPIATNLVKKDLGL